MADPTDSMEVSDEQEENLHIEQENEGKETSMEEGERNQESDEDEDDDDYDQQQADDDEQDDEEEEESTTVNKTVDLSLDDPYFVNNIEIKETPNTGRFTLSAIDLEENDVIFLAYPYSVVCHEAFKKAICHCCFYFDDDKYNESEELDFCCSACGQVWYCSEKCQQEDYKKHGTVECDALSSLDTVFDCAEIVTEVRLLIRTLAMRYIEPQLKPDEWHNYQSVSNLVSNQENISKPSQESLKEISDYANSLCREDAQIDEDELLGIFLKQRCNMFGLWEDDTCVAYGVYPVASLLNHACVANCTYVRDPKTSGTLFEFIALQPIKKGEELNISYIEGGYDTDSLEDRRKHLKENYFFDCTCKQCLADLKEVGWPIEVILDDEEEDEEEEGDQEEGEESIVEEEIDDI